MVKLGYVSLNVCCLIHTLLVFNFEKFMEATGIQINFTSKFVQTLEVLRCATTDAHLSRWKQLRQISADVANVRLT